MQTTKDILTIMATGEPFSLVAISYDRKRKRGGQIQVYEEAVLLKNQTALQAHTKARPLTTIEEKRAVLEHLKKDPNHRRHYTRNIRILQDGHPTAIIKKIHPPLIIEFNGEPVAA